MERVPKGDEGSFSVTDALTNPILDRKGVWKRFVRGVNADAETLLRMQEMIRDYVTRSVSTGKMDENVLKVVEGLMKYKNTTFQPVKTNDYTREITYRLAGKVQSKAA